MLLQLLQMKEDSYSRQACKRALHKFYVNLPLLETIFIFLLLIIKNFM